MLTNILQTTQGEPSSQIHSVNYTKLTPYLLLPGFLPYKQTYLGLLNSTSLNYYFHLQGNEHNKQL